MTTVASIERDWGTSRHWARNARTRGHAETCEMVAGFWTTVHGVPVNWPTLYGRPDCTCGREPERRGGHTHL